MHMGSIGNFADDEVTKKTILEVRQLWGRSGNTHEHRLILLAPMAVMCSEKMFESVRATILESETRELYRVLRSLGG